MMVIRIGTRGSPLAVWQANWVQERLTQAHPRLNISLIKIKTKGDKLIDVNLEKVGGKGLFVKEIEEELLGGQIDLAVHSMKDVPVQLPKGLHIRSIPRREDPGDVLISRDHLTLEELPLGAKIGTSSLRRKAQLLSYRPDFHIVPLRGNVDTRLRKLDSMGLDGIVLAAAGVKRMRLEGSISQSISPEVCLPAIGQGALGIETRIADEEVNQYLGILDHEATHMSVIAERAFLRRLEGGCQVPVAALGGVSDRGMLMLKGLVGTLDGRKLIKGGIEGEIEKAEELGMDLAESLLSQGADEVLREIYEREIARAL
ncbi:MAG: hydroxymethylbilane synthase [Syntrophobacterales bacterium]|nr:MAG: hydroxymethylbilane synthase [Syntrophobacterales bacterium]